MNRLRSFRASHVTTIIVALCVAVVAFPVGVFAAGISRVRIADAAGAANVAQVNAGKLRVGDGRGPVTVDGTVSTIPGSSFSTSHDLPITTPVTLRSGLSAGTKLRLTSITISNTEAGPVTFELRGRPSCAGPVTATTTYFRVYLQSLTSETFTFPTPLSVDDRCAAWYSSNGSGFVVATGYTTR